MSIGLSILTAMILSGVIVLTVRVGLCYRRNTVGQYWLNLIDAWAKICPVHLLTSQRDTEDDSEILVHLTPCVNVILKDSDLQMVV